ncbi:MAG TPA: carbon-nitrogen hydrolase family protein [Woeseiaceae bacterium]|jgi:nitrilase|nr:carbon-nitrogen hydrolase family protein [Woeseiaceae bacterium]
MRVAAVQMNSGHVVDQNLQVARGLLAQAAADGCVLAVLPENFALMPNKSRDKAAHAESPGVGPIQAFLADAAQELGLWIIGGSIPLVSPEAERVYGACPVYDSDGVQQACYRKIHLFDVQLPDSAEAYQESWSMYPGDEPVAVDTPVGRVGLSICYDLRFPELYRRLVDDGAGVFTVPAAFTRTTGEAHWQVLLRARAVENLAYVIAPGQFGQHADNRATFGHSMIVDPWGRVLAEAPDEACVVAADIDPDRVSTLREQFPALANRRL